MTSRFRMGLRAALFTGTALVCAGVAPDRSLAQTGASEAVGLEEIVVTAQKRSQNLQDVPIAVTALSEETLQANRVVSVVDLSGLAPGVTVRIAPGAAQLPSFTMRGAVSYGVTPGSDKQVSIYVDGVYISSPRGSLFDLPDISRIEMLRGPQGTLFGRNATAGAVSVTTRDPTGEFGVKQEVTVGNYDQFRSRTSVDLPAMGPFSGYATYVHNYKRGDVRNAGAGFVWDRSRSPEGLGTTASPKWLGTKKSDSVFAALKFEPTDDFTTVYKFDLVREKGTPVATGFVGFNPATPLIGPLMSALIASQPTPVYVDTTGRRPKVVNNSYTIPFDQKVSGHSLTSTWRASDAITVKNIAAYRESRVFSASPIDGLSGLTLTSQALGPYATFIAFSSTPALAAAPPATQAAAIQQVAASLAPTVGSPLIIIGAQPSLHSKQWSDELQVNYDSDLVTLTAGGLWFRSEDRAGLVGMQNTTTFTVIPGGVVPLGRQGLSLNKATSIAAYMQAELHATSKLDLVAGYRITRDHKTGTLTFGASPALTTFANPDYRKTKPTYLVGANFKPAEDMLVYAKYSTGFVSGGEVATVPFEPETVKSWEAGMKADFLDRRLRTNLAVYQATYRHFQSAQGSTNFANLLGPLTPFIGTFVLDAGTVKAKGFEFEGSAAPVRGMTLGGSVGFMDTKFSDTPQVLITQSAGAYVPTFRPKWTVGLWGQYETEPVVGDATVLLRMDANWRSRAHLDSNPNRNVPQFAVIRYVPSAWLLNARIALRGFQVGGADAELAVWGRNLANNRDVINGVLNGFEAAAFYEQARTVGVDLMVKF